MELPLRTGTVPSAKETLLKRSPTVTARGPTGTMAYCGKIWELFAVFRQGLRKTVHYPWGWRVVTAGGFLLPWARRNQRKSGSCHWETLAVWRQLSCGSVALDQGTQPA